jgi:protein-tyrosine sulfotransferase
MVSKLRQDRSELSLLDDVRKYLAYVFDRRSFAPSFAEQPLSERVLEAAAAIRGRERAPALIIHGVMPRAGTVYAGELLRLHPDLVAYPGRIWEAPLLQLAGDVDDLQEKFLWAHRHNIGKLGQRDFLPLLGAAFLAYLGNSVPEDKRILLKVPGVHHLSDFTTMFPHEHLLVLMRDGRDVVHSTLKTWPQLMFWMACRRWKRSARMVLACDERWGRSESTHPRPFRAGQTVQRRREWFDAVRHRQTARGRFPAASLQGAAHGYWLGRFEHAVEDPAGFVRAACAHFGLDEERYPFERIGEVAVRGSSSLQEQGDVDWQPREKPEGFDPTGHWRDWSRLRTWTFKRIAGQELIALGYCEDLEW